MFSLSNHLLLLLLLPLLSSLASSQKNQNISLDSTITTSGTTTSWLSPSGDFAFGFLPFPTNTSLFILSIYFAKTNEKSIVWYPKDVNFPLLSDSKLHLTSDGQLLLTDFNNKTIWNPFPSSGSFYAALLDTGNLILAAADSSPNWESFDFPTDTILPTQPLYKNNKLRSHLYDDNYTNGRFELVMQTDGNLVLYPLALLTDSANNYDAYWATMTLSTGKRLMFDDSGALYLELDNKTRVNITASNLSTDEFYQRVTLDIDGGLRHYVHPKDATKNGSLKNEWTVIATVPSDICRRLNGDTGSGACGFNSYCQLDQNLRRSCKCPPSFSFMDKDDMYKGCKPDFVAPSCGDGGGQVYNLIEMANTDWPGSDYEHYVSFDEDQCRNNCFNDCFCAVAIFRGTDCWKKRLPLSKGRTGNDIGGKALIKVGTTNSSALDPVRQQIEDKGKGRKVWLLVGLSTLIVSLFILLGSIMVVVMVLSSSKYKRIQLDSSIAGSTLRCFTYKELEEATNGFKKELGSGAFGTVYEGFLPPNPKTCVAVKKLDNMLKEKEKEFMAEVRSIGQTHHKNLVRLFGYCDEGTNRLLVYEFMSNGSLTNFLFEGARPGWKKRVEIVLGIARGLLYLHEECSNSIIHCDIKLQNILLDDELTPRISDFGLAKLLKPDQTRTNTGIRGTKGYVAPEWFRNMAITTKVDVYSFGVMLLEIICCRKNLELELTSEDETVLIYWAYDCYQQGKVDVLIGDDEEAMANFENFSRLLMVAIWCIQEDPSQRPTMRRINQMLDCSIVVPPPHDPFSNKVPNAQICSEPLLS